MRRAALVAVLACRAASLVVGRRTMARLAPLRAVEVEEKFAVRLGREAMAAKVAALGGTERSVVAFRDEYFDTEALALTTRDTWLRRRDGAWELKVPHGARRASGGETTVFREVTDEREIVAELRALGVVGDGALPFAGLAVFADFETVRAKYDLGGVKIDVDEASYGHKVLELEVMTDGGAAELAAARAAIADAAAKLGCEPLPAGAGGKLETFLRRFRPAHARAIGLLE